MITSYGDDFTAAPSATKSSVAAEALGAHAADIINWANRKGLTVSTSKSDATLFTPNTAQFNDNPNIPWSDEALSLEQFSKILGVTLNLIFNYSRHAETVAAIAGFRLNILRALTGTTRGQDKETILITYKSLISFILHYTAPVWFPNLRNTPLM